MPLPWLASDTPFPPPQQALDMPDGLLCLGGDLSPQRLLAAYRQGIFPWFAEGEPLMWWSPNPRMVFASDGVHLARRFRRVLRHSTWHVRADTAFSKVITACAHSPRPGQEGTWLTAEMIAAYQALHRLGHAHSVEVFDGEQLVGGIYGVAIGQMFFAESMFSAHSGGSKVALAMLAAFLREQGWPLIDAQVENPHLLRMGAKRMARDTFLALVARQTALPGLDGSWQVPFGNRPAHHLCAVRAR